MALDYGERRIGVAVTDPSGRLAQPLETLERSHRAPGGALSRICELVDEYDVGQIVVGLPLQMDGHPGALAETTRAFGAEVEARTGVAVEYLDERLTSAQAKRVLAETGGRPGRNKDRVDRVAAAILLDTYLERSTR
jgi:putative Holliday junction resolvase